MHIMSSLSFYGLWQFHIANTLCRHKMTPFDTCVQKITQTNVSNFHLQEKMFVYILSIFFQVFWQQKLSPIFDLALLRKTNMKYGF